MRRFLIIFVLFFYSPIFSEGCGKPLLGWSEFAHDLHYLTICNQGKYPHCSLHALKTFLESWALFTHHYHDPSNELMHGIPKVDTSYLALAFNSLVGKGATGHNLPYLTFSLAKYGAIETGSIPLDTPSIVWPFPRWQRFHNTRFLEPEQFETLFHSSFRSPRPHAPITTPSSFLSDTLKFSTRNFHWVGVNNSPYQFKSDSQKEETKTYRTSNHWKSLSEQASQEGHLLGRLYSSRDLLAHLIEQQLDAKMPVLFSIIGTTQHPFQRYEGIGKRDILPPNQEPSYTHALTAIALCRENDFENPLCQHFLEWVETEREPCVVIQNSYGKKNHYRGRVCMSLSALAEIVFEAWIHRSIFVKTNLQPFVTPQPYFLESANRLY